MQIARDNSKNNKILLVFVILRKTEEKQKNTKIQLKPELMSLIIKCYTFGFYRT